MGTNSKLFLPNSSFTAAYYSSEMNSAHPYKERTQNHTTNANTDSRYQAKLFK
jgi:hypothetical protein